jgi:hypothetical protein
MAISIIGRVPYLPKNARTRSGRTCRVVCEHTFSGT